MPHFDCFLEFAAQGKAKDFFSRPKVPIFRDQAAKAIEAFSDVYMNERRYENAIRVLEFTNQVYTGNVRFRIGIMLAKAYFETPRKDPPGLERMLKALRDEAMNVDNDMNKYELSLYLVRLYRDKNYLDDIHKAQKVLSKDLDGLKLQMKNGRPTLPETQPRHLRKYSIKVQVEDARVNHAKRELQMARSGLDDALKAIRAWFPSDDEWVMETDEVKAGVLCDIRTYEALQEAEDQLKANIETWREQKKREPRALEAERLLVMVLAKCPLDKVRAALKLLEKITPAHEKIYGSQDKATKKCQALLEQVKEREELLLRQHRISIAGVVGVIMASIMYWFISATIY
jgi:hypothetical protein